MFGNTALSFEDNIDLESVVINQENFDLNKIRFPKIEEENGL